MNHVFQDRLQRLNEQVGTDPSGQLALAKLTRREAALLKADAYRKLVAAWPQILAIHMREYTLARRADPSLTVAQFLAARRG